ncbi:hypothetical protein PRZ48_011597 [Zasmidium cellare]|uniref:Uncharacterized protein n=1 Tax=Zasmidium cellare TaxID=395010 RepID=A0ABR0E6T3_ZASCE|nr:hypothetical protein PRZ48_011597 [Zasmidium cellare]
MAGFLDLPFEIRCVFYKQYLKDDNLIEMEMVCDLKSRRRRLGLRWPHKSTVSPALLFINKEINAEAASIFYSINKFFFDDIDDLNALLRLMGPSKAQHLRHIGYQRLATTPQLEELVTHLTPAKFLTSLTISHEMIDKKGWFRTHSAKQVVKLLAPLLEVVGETRKNEFDDKNDDVSGIVSIRATRWPMWYGRSWNRSDAVMQEAEAVDAEVKALVKELYG